VVGSAVAKRPTLDFLVKLTDYGWSVQCGASQLGLFKTRDQALTDVKRRRDELKANGQGSTLVVIGIETESRFTQPLWTRR
jgi:hypothetical protein